MSLAVVLEAIILVCMAIAGLALRAWREDLRTQQEWILRRAEDVDQKSLNADRVLEDARAILEEACVGDGERWWT